MLSLFTFSLYKNFTFQEPWKIHRQILTICNYKYSNTASLIIVIKLKIHNDIICKAYYETLVKDLAFLNLKSGGEGNLTCFF